MLQLSSERVRAFTLNFSGLYWQFRNENLLLREEDFSQTPFYLINKVEKYRCVGEMRRPSTQPIS